jgi:imidazolonepropionase-like amidohydrolase
MHDRRSTNRRAKTKTITIAVMSMLFCSQASLFAQTRDRAAKGSLAITHVNVIDVTGGQTATDSTVLIVGDRIGQIGKSDKIKIPKDAETVDATGKFLIPGLWEMHGHISFKEFIPLFIANGVTGVREMGGNPSEFQQLKEWRRQISSGELIGPRIIAAGIIVDGPKATGRRDSLNVENPTEARQAVASLKQQGADFIKVYSMLPRDSYFAIADEAKKQGLSFAGHIPASVTAEEASNAGQKSLEHLFGVFSACSKDAARLHEENNAAVSKSGIAVFVGAEIKAELKALDTYDDAKASALFALFVRNHTWHVPTLVGWQTLSSSDESRFQSDPRLKYIPRERRDQWKAQKAALIRGFDPDYFTGRERLFQAQLRFVKAMHDAGVKLMAGTDTAGLYEYPGYSLHEELGLLVKAGLTPLEALRAATLSPAEYFGLQRSLGTVEAGKTADLVLLDANPLDDIASTKRIAAVVLRGKLISRSKLDEMLSAVESSIASQ